MATQRDDAATTSHEVVRVDRAELPDLDVPTGVFCSRNDLVRIDAGDDNNAELMSCLYPFHRED
ncbi:hypothetical protein [Novosphingobium sp. P6W]|jgi:hypothetical protein|uniref:hypothetical protein n=1 Tax=Novosphingobium sp. P6W TaxID=1609758 RepID=UPI0005C2E8CE|nr:hypothetical protein [Novosphingobium sp. P6W]AXB77676.1 hypothetical protein TQ38_015160 [Novosphingobium sp. P6W]KIS34024.1 hypothetical protein TQ38_05075 [Novosphingobium sp. P6W]